ncbi:MAG: MFS transporter [Deinococcota bacterium]
MRPAPLPTVFWLLAVTNVFVGGMVGLERTLVPLLATRDFHLEAGAAALAFITGFGIAKAFGNLAVGGLADRYGRLLVLRAGWLLAWPVPLALLLAHNWWVVILANILLGIQQALTWSMTVNMMVDAAGSARRGLASGINELAGYLGVSLAALLTGVLAGPFGLRAPLALGFLVALLGTVLAFQVQETGRAAPPPLTLPAALQAVTWRHPELSSATLLGFVTNLKDGAVWGLLPIVLTARHLPLAEVALVTGIYPLVWALSQALFGPLSDRLGRRGLAVSGVLLQGGALWLLAQPAQGGLTKVAAVLLGLGTGMAYPTLLAWVADASGPTWQATALGVYRFWRDAGYAGGALGAGALASHLGGGAALTWAAFLLLGAAVVAGLRSSLAGGGAQTPGAT